MHWFVDEVKSAKLKWRNINNIVADCGQRGTGDKEVNKSNKYADKTCLHGKNTTRRLEKTQDAWTAPSTSINLPATALGNTSIVLTVKDRDVVGRSSVVSTRNQYAHTNTQEQLCGHCVLFGTGR